MFKNCKEKNHIKLKSKILARNLQRFSVPIIASV